jgi:hypothetical protein
MTEEDQKTEATQKIIDKHREQGNLVTMYEREISHLKHQLGFYKAREERLWHTLMAMPNSLRHYDGWQPIETAPKDHWVLVYEPGWHL